MKHFLSEPLRNWFGHTRRERRASTILLIFTGIVILIRIIIPDKRIPIEEITLELPVKNAALYNNGGYPGQEPEASGQKLNRYNRVKIELNKCDSGALESLPGIGPVLSARIIKYRNLLGGFASVDQLKEVYGLSEETFNLIAGRVTADPALIRKIDINNADFRQLSRMPYFDKYEINAILKYRGFSGSMRSLDELIDNKLVAADKYIKLKPYLEIK